MLSLDSKSSMQMPSLTGDYAGMSAEKQINGVLQQHQLLHRHIWIITGPAGCGKSSIAVYLAKELAIPYIEGDDYHSSSNRQKMSQGVPLTDADRWDWLISLREAAVNRLSPSASSVTKAHTGVVVTCSALKAKYRDVIRIAAYKDHNVAVHFIYLQADEEVLLKRVQARQGHYMKSAMVRSQFLSLEEPDKKEQKLDCLDIDCTVSLIEVQRKVVAKVRETLADDV